MQRPQAKTPNYRRIDDERGHDITEVMRSVKPHQLLYVITTSLPIADAASLHIADAASRHSCSTHKCFPPFCKPFHLSDPRDVCSAYSVVPSRDIAAAPLAAVEDIVTPCFKPANFFQHWGLLNYSH
jgi:hypothetical protein